MSCPTTLSGKQSLNSSSTPQSEATLEAPDNLTAADIKFARFYYQQALTHGVGAARARLDALAKP